MRTLNVILWNLEVRELFEPKLDWAAVVIGEREQ